ncbi:MAG: MurR/RpiR family transcriptional regulator [Terrisporobacter sp.]|uniref:MurR/RpiR family transcriptional regulator n=1 Tax=Terrisporobacter sp. TaxID=1965305 RepID=UPI002FCA5B42
MYLPALTDIQLTKNEKVIYDFLLSKRQSIFMYTEVDISNITGVSQPTVSRFWKKIGFSNFKDFKEKVKENNNNSSPSLKFNSLLNSEKFHYKNYVDHSISLIEESAQKINEDDFNKAIDLFVNSNKIFTHGIGPAEFLSSLLIFRLSRFGLNISSLPSNGQEIYEGLLHSEENDLFVLFLFSHYHPETYVLLDYAKKNNIKVILITDIFIKPIEQENMLTIYVSRGELFEFHSLTGPLFLIESLIVSIGMLREKQSLSKLKKLEKMRKDYEEFIPRNLK